MSMICNCRVFSPGSSPQRPEEPMSSTPYALCSRRPPVPHFTGIAPTASQTLPRPSAFALSLREASQASSACFSPPVYFSGLIERCHERLSDKPDLADPLAVKPLSRPLSFTLRRHLQTAIIGRAQRDRSGDAPHYITPSVSGSIPACVLGGDSRAKRRHVGERRKLTKATTSPSERRPLCRTAQALR